MLESHASSQRCAARQMRREQTDTSQQASVQLHAHAPCLLTLHSPCLSRPALSFSPSLCAFPDNNRQKLPLHVRAVSEDNSDTARASGETTVGLSVQCTCDDAPLIPHVCCAVLVVSSLICNGHLYCVSSDLFSFALHLPTIRAQRVSAPLPP